jgi:polyferredoxin
MGVKEFFWPTKSKTAFFLVLVVISTVSFFTALVCSFDNGSSTAIRFCQVVLPILFLIIFSMGLAFILMAWLLTSLNLGLLQNSNVSILIAVLFSLLWWWTLTCILIRVWNLVHAKNIHREKKIKQKNEWSPNRKKAVVAIIIGVFLLLIIMVTLIFSVLRT